MKVVIPMAGRGIRFANSGFNVPKPLIHVKDKPMFQWTVECVKRGTGVNDSDFIFIVLKEHVDQHGIDKTLKKNIKGSTVIVIPEVTRGAAETAYQTRSKIGPDEEMFLTDSDQYFEISQFEKIRKEAVKKGYAGIIGVQDSDNPAYSYAELGNDGFVKRTAEKELISRNAAVGIYYFTKSRYFMEAIEQMMANNMTTRNEYYVCPVYNLIIPKGKVIIFKADFWMTMGTPEEKIKFEDYINSKNA